MTTNAADLYTREKADHDYADGLEYAAHRTVEFRGRTYYASAGDPRRWVAQECARLARSWGYLAVVRKVMVGRITGPVWAVFITKR
jgi:hypothetical protein